MLNYKELPADGTDLERLAREIFIREGYETEWTGKGADGGRDLIIKEKLVGPISEFERIWLVQCKHKAHSGDSANKADSNSIVTDCKRIGATGYLMICTTQPSSGLMQAFRELQSSEFIVKYWDGVILENILFKPCNFPLLHTFFPISSKTIGWRIYNTNSPSFWAANYKHSFFYLSSRLSMNFNSFRMVEKIYAMMEEASAKYKYNLELRAIYFDDKHTNYTAFIDQLMDENKVRDPFSDTGRLQLGPMIKDGSGYIPISWDVRAYTVSPHSDSYDSNAQHYYEPYINNFKTGAERPGAIRFW
jgi:hypothetical protein